MVPCSPSHVTRPPPNSIESLQEKYKAADAKLLELEAELDVLFNCVISIPLNCVVVHCLFSQVHSVREQRTKMSVTRLKHSDGGETTVDANDSTIISPWLRRARTSMIWYATCMRHTQSHETLDEDKGTQGSNVQPVALSASSFAKVFAF